MTTTRTKTKPAAPAEGGWAGPRSLALFEEEQGYLTPGLQQIAVFSKLAMAKGRGAVLTDEDGKEYLDLVAGVCVASIGHGHPVWAKALAEQAAALSVGSFTTRARVEFGRRLMPRLPKGLDRVQLYSSGAEAVEAAFRLAKSRTGHFEFAGFWGGFHGKTGGVLPLLGDTSFKQALGPLMPGTYSFPFPNPYRCPFKNEAPHDCAAHCLEFLREGLKRQTTGSLAALICEPVQGTAGNVIPPAGWLRGLKEVAAENGALLVADEMITGFGRTGRWFGVEHEGVTPDVITLGKGVAGGFPVSGVVTSAAVAQSKPFANPSGSSSSYGGNPLASAACAATLKVLEEERLVENSAKVGARMLARLEGMKERFRFIGDVRGRGLMIGVELVADRKTKEPLSKDLCRSLFEDGLKNGLLTMAYSPVIRVNPPLNITADQADEALGRLERCFERLAAKA